jgi:hypothetical protein
VEVAEDAVARANDRDRLALDEHAERVAIAGEDGLDDRAFIEGRPFAGGEERCGRGDGSPPGPAAERRHGVAGRAHGDGSRGWP